MEGWRDGGMEGWRLRGRGSCEDDCESPRGRLQWRSGQGQAFAQGGFLVADNRIVVPQTGLYFVYSQASFRVPCGDGGGEEEEEEEEAAARRRRHAPLSHRIWRYSDSLGRKASLMNAVRSACQSGGAREDGQGWYNAIYLGAAFQLQRGDTLWTETNQLAALETEDGRTFFGVFAL
ncbi:Tumor necrosis factor [Liparis tanakae]|uniref:Lymphotoxin-alpha n=1 Tax=Liparis tanakae TaxID=230148 RepID=A0A4Z2EU67_9TELE|nr:Tumor necrosis factor [Liparis tanakae]